MSGFGVVHLNKKQETVGDVMNAQSGKAQAPQKPRPGTPNGTTMPNKTQRDQKSRQQKGRPALSCFLGQESGQAAKHRHPSVAESADQVVKNRTRGPASQTTMGSCFIA